MCRDSSTQPHHQANRDPAALNLFFSDLRLHSASYVVVWTRFIGGDGQVAHASMTLALDPETPTISEGWHWDLGEV